MSGAKRRRFRWIAISAASIALLLLGYSFLAAWQATHPKREQLRTNPSYWGLSYKNVRFRSQKGDLTLRGWWIPAKGSRLTVVIAHAYTENREDDYIPGYDVADLLHQMGANILMFDFRGEGNSQGSLVTVGVDEQWDLVAAAREAERHLASGVPVAVWGFSMGASTALLAAEDDPQIRAVIADSPYSDLRSYLEKNLSQYTGLPSFPFSPLLLVLFPPLFGIDLSQANPVAHMERLGTRPVLLIAGTKDKTIPYLNAKKLYSAGRRTDPHIQLWLVPKAHHVQAFQLRPIAYAKKLWQILHQVDPSLRRPALPYGA